MMKYDRIKEYINHWNDFMVKWIEDPEEVFKNDLLSIKHSGQIDTQLKCNYLPQPYLGDPSNCSAVTLNLNPGKLIESRMHPNGYFIKELKNSKDYFEYAKDFPQLKKNSTFWKNQINWINRLVEHENGEKNLPFAIEICHWHSIRWKNFKLDNELLDYFEKMVFGVIVNVIETSRLKTVLSIGSQYAKLYEKLGFKRLLEISHKNCSEFSLDYPLNKINKPSNRTYSLWQSRTGTKYLNTYTVSNKPPSKEWLEIDKYIIDFDR
ncbi:MAG: hypothetical protein PHR06_02380 [Candidatus Cloacimonetes bacterium]|nr:hypothetical protein [Candidatus Cloacimonadota bacterium]